MSDLERQSVSLGSNPALIAVDFNNGFVDPESPLASECNAAIEVNQKLLGCFRQRGLPIFFTTVAYSDDNQASVFRHRLPDLDTMQSGTRWVDIIDELAPQNGEPVIEKQWASGFFKTDLAQRLQDASADSLVITGLTTSGCVRATALDGLQHNYAVWVVEDGCADRNPEAHKSNLFDLNAKYADVVDSGSVLTALGC